MSDFSKQLIRVNPSTLYRDLAGEAVLLQLDSGEYFGLDDVGNRFWQLVVADGHVGRVFEQMLSEYDVDEATLTADLGHLIDELVERRLIDVEHVQSPR